jgi:hypothetical protein
VRPGAAHRVNHSSGHGEEGSAARGVPGSAAPGVPPGAQGGHHLQGGAGVFSTARQAVQDRPETSLLLTVRL